MIHRCLFHAKPGAQPEGRREGFSLLRMTPALFEADIGELEVEQSRRGELGAIELGCDYVFFRFAE